MKSRRVVIALSQGRIDAVALNRGRAVGRARAQVELGSDARDWPRQLRECAETIASLVRKVGRADCAVEVLYVSPTQAIDQVSLPARSAADAEEAAVLGATESLAYAGADAIVQACVAGRDTAGEGVRKMHVVVSADRDDVLSAITETLEAGGLHVATVTPLEAPVIAAVLRGTHVNGAATRGRLFMGELSSFLAVAEAGHLCFGRRISLGVRNLVVSLTRPLPGAAGATTAEMDPEHAADALYACGIHRPGGSAALPDGPTAQQLLPLMQPVLQRLVVELRQSLRFGTTESQRSGLSLVLTGPGAAIPGMADLIGSELNVSTECEPRCASYQHADPASEGCELLEAARQPDMLQRLNLLPRREAVGRKMRSLRNWLWSGAAVALATLAFDTVRYETRLNDARSRAQSLSLRTAGIDVLRTTSRRLSTALTAMNELESRVSRETGQCPDVAALMHELGRLTPSSIRLMSITVTRAGDRIECLLTGHAPQSEGRGQTTLDGYVDSLRSSPLLSDVALRNVQFTSNPGNTAAAQQFEVVFAAVARPGDAMQAAAAPDGKEGAP